MIVAIVANYAVDGNVIFPRMVDAILSTGNECFLISRSRMKSTDQVKQVSESQFQQYGLMAENYVINIPADVGQGMKNILNLLRYIFVVFKTLVKYNKRIDVAHAVDLDAGLPVLLFSKLYRKPYVYHIADFYVDSRPGIPRFMQNMVRKLEFKVINNAYSTFICTESRENQIKGSKPNRLEVIHNSPVITIDRAQKDSLNKPIKLCYVGGLSSRRFIKEIIETVKNDERFSLEIAGYGELNDYVSNSANMFNNIHFHGAVSYENAINLYKEGDIILSIYDPTVANHKYSAPNKVYEGMMLGRSVIVAENTGMDNLIKEMAIGIVIEYSADSFSKALDYIHNNQATILEMSQNAAALYPEFSWDKMKQKINLTYGSLEKSIEAIE